ncbi:hypothetical protein BDR06DRAFT_969141 [Suillus hirtellus]|nr:hypothetical protein BDR06DRAFT_969141 [Suillus hirtellus]
MNAGHNRFLCLPIQKKFEPKFMTSIYHKKSINKIKVAFDSSIISQSRNMNLNALYRGKEQKVDGAEDDVQALEIAINQKDAKIYGQFCFDIIKNAPNRKFKQAGSYLSIPVHRACLYYKPTKQKLYLYVSRIEVKVNVLMKMELDCRPWFV